MLIQQEYSELGYAAPIDILNQDQVAYYRTALETAEARLGSLHYKHDVQTLLKSVYEMATNSRILDAVEQIIGPNIRLYCATFVIKEAQSESFVSWHQDLTYWGLDDSEKVVSGWLALSPATKESGCMKMIPGSHKRGQLAHSPTDASNNVLLQGQTVSDLDTDDGVLCPLQPGQMSLHHGWTLHQSMPNRSKDRRIGLNLQYLAPSVKPTNGSKLPTSLVRGVDSYGHYIDEIPATGEADEASMARHKEYEAVMMQAYKSKHSD
jgi:hypothetical protein